MTTIVLIACSKQKLDHPAPAWRLYTSPLFRKSLAYAQTLGGDKIYILSAKHGLVELGQVLAPYDLTLSDIPAAKRKEWACQVIAELGMRHPWNVHFVILAGKLYHENLTRVLSSFELPLEGMGIGQRISFLTAAIDGGTAMKPS